MTLLQSAMRILRPAAGARTRTTRDSAKRLRFESLETRQLLTTVPFTIINNTIKDAAGQLAFFDTQIQIALYAQDFSSATPPYYYFKADGSAHLTTDAPVVNGVKTIPTFALSQLHKVSEHTYTIDLPEDLPSGAPTGMNSARMYFSIDATPVLTVNSDAVGSVNAPVPNNSFIDFIEFTLQAPNSGNDNLNIDTTNVDQFSMPITIAVNPGAPGNTVGINQLRQDVIQKFETFTSDAGDPYALCIWPVSDPTYGPYRILNPSGVLSGATSAQVNIQSTTTTIGGLDNVNPTATVHVIDGSPFPQNPSQTNFFEVKIEQETMKVVGAAKLADGTTNWTVDRSNPQPHDHGKLVSIVGPAVSVSQTTLTVPNTTNFPQSGSFNIIVDKEIMTVTGVNSTNANDGSTTWNVLRGQDGTTATSHDSTAIAIYDSVTSLGLNSTFNAAVDALFTQYHGTGNKLYIYSNADGTGKTYEGIVTRGNGPGTPWVMRFTDKDNPSGTVFDVYYPFFKDNAYYYAGYNPALPDVESAPSWAAGANVATMSPSEMVFACDGVFADNKFRPAGEYTTGEVKVLADLENQMVSALNRGVGKLQGVNIANPSDTTNTWADASLYYNKNPDQQVWNRYAEFLHRDDVSINGQNYGFAFDDQDGHASDISETGVTGASITLKPWADTTVPNPPTPPTPPVSAGMSLRHFMASLLARESEVEGDSLDAQTLAAIASPDASPMNVVDAAFGDSSDSDDGNESGFTSFAADSDDQESEPNVQPGTPAQMMVAPSMRNLFSSRARG